MSFLHFIYVNNINSSSDLFYFNLKIIKKDGLFVITSSSNYKSTHFLLVKNYGIAILNNITIIQTSNFDSYGLIRVIGAVQSPLLSINSLILMY